jgi:putative transcriptional regulator
MSDAATPLAGKLLIAMPGLVDPNFWHAVVLVGVHSSEEGAFGLVINRPLNVELNEILEELGESVAEERLPQVLAGGPVEPNHGFVVFEGQGQEADETALAVDSDIMVSGSTETLANLARGRLGGRYHLFWATQAGIRAARAGDRGQLLARGPAHHHDHLRESPSRRWTAALRSIGVEPVPSSTSGTGAPT